MLLWKYNLCLALDLLIILILYIIIANVHATHIHVKIPFTLRRDVFHLLTNFKMWLYW